MKQAHDIPLPVPKGDETAPLEKIEAETRLLARCALVALAAEGRYMNMQVRHFVFDTINIHNATMAHYTWDLVDSGRFEYTPSDGLVPGAGAFPVSVLEYETQTGLVRPAKQLFDNLAQVAIDARASLSEQAEQIVAAQRTTRS